MSCIKGGICEHGGCSNCMGEPNVKLQEDWKGQAMSADNVKNSKRIWIYRTYSDVNGMGEYVSWKPEGSGDAKEYIAVTEHEAVVAELKAENERLRKAFYEVASLVDCMCLGDEKCWACTKIDKIHKTFEDDKTNRSEEK